MGSSAIRSAPSQGAPRQAMTLSKAKRSACLERKPHTLSLSLASSLARLLAWREECSVILSPLQRHTIMSILGTTFALQLTNMEVETTPTPSVEECSLSRAPFPLQKYNQAEGSPTSQVSKLPGPVVLHKNGPQCTQLRTTISNHSPTCLVILHADGQESRKGFSNRLLRQASFAKLLNLKLIQYRTAPRSKRP